VSRRRVDGRVSYAHAAGDVAVLAEDAEMSAAASLLPEPTVPAFAVVKTPRGYVCIEYALPTSVAEAAVQHRAEPDIRSMAIERVLSRLDEEHNG
jgi:hypothetical protein